MDQVDLVLGTRCGSLVTARISEELPDKIKWNVEAIGVARVDVFPSSAPFDGTSTAFACCDNKLILLSNFSPADCKFNSKHYIWPTDLSEPSMPSPLIHSIHRIPQNLSGQDGHTSLLILAGSRLLLADFGPHVGNVPRSIPIQGSPTRVLLSRTLNCLIVAVITPDDKPTLVFLDPDTGEVISVPTDKDRNQIDFISGLGAFGDRIYGLHEWLYKKDGKTFPFILVTTKAGRLIIVSTEKVDRRPGGPGSRQLRYWTRYKKRGPGSIYSIVGDAEGLVYCADRTLHLEVLNLAERRLTPVKELQLDSPAVSLRVSHGKIFALTSMHSLEVVDYQSAEEGTMELIHSDQVSRRTVHMIEMGDPTDGSGRWPLTLVSDQAGFIAGLWVPLAQRDREFDVVFEGMLSSSVRRFARAHIRPPWQVDNTQRRYGTLPSTQDGSDIIGVSLDGSMKQFSLLSLDLWRFLFTVQVLAQQSAALASVNTLPADNDVDVMNLDVQLNPKMMHIDGDLMKKCLKLRILEKIAESDDIFDLLSSHLDAIEGGSYTVGFRDEGEVRRRERYFGLGYEILQYLVAPAL